MTRSFRIGLAAAGGLALVLALGFGIQARWATGLWPLEAGRLSHIFVASILAAIGGPAIWIAAANEGRAIAAGAADLFVTSLGCAVTALWSWSASGNPKMLAFGVLSVAGAVIFAAMFRRWHRVPFRDRRPTPWPLRVAFLLFAAALAVVAVRLVLAMPETFPWPLSTENARIYGFIFLGAMVYFLYGLVYPVWGNAAGQMVGFLLYDLVLIVPFIGHFATVPPDLALNHAIYTGVVAVSGLLGLWYLVLDPATRLGSRTEPAVAA